MPSLVLSTVGAALLAVPQQPQAVLEIVSLQHVCSPSTELLPPPMGTLLRWTDPDARVDLLGIREGGRGIDADRAADVLRQLHAEACENGKLSIEPEGTNLIVVGDGALVNQVRDEIDQLAAVLLRPLQIEAALWHIDAGEAPPAVLSPGDWRTWFADRQPLWRSSATTQPSRPVALDGQRWTTYVCDVDTEVAQKQSISQPIADAFCEGGRVVVVPHALLGGDELAVHVQFGLARRRGAVRTAPTGVAGQSDLDLPVLESLFGACSARLQHGGGIAVTLRGHASAGGNHVLTVRAGSPVPPPTTTLAGIAALPCSALIDSALHQRLSPPDPYPRAEENDEYRFPETIELDGGFGRLEPERLLDLLRSSIDENATPYDLHVGSGHLFVIGPESVRTAVEALLLGLQQRFVRNIAIRHEVRRTGGADADPLHELVLPSLLGREATIARLLEMRALDHIYVDIAQEAAIHDPDVRTLQSGVWLRCRAAPARDTLHVDLLAQCTHAEPPLLRSIVPSGGNLLPTDIGVARAVHDALVANGRPIDHGDGPTVTLDGRSHRTVMTTQLRW